MTFDLEKWIADHQDELIAAARSVSGATSAFVPVIVLVPSDALENTGDVVYHENGDVEIRPPVATMSGRGFTPGA